MKILTTLLFGFVTLAAQADIPVLMYHRVSSDASSETNINLPNLFEHFQTIKSLGYETITISELTAYLKGELELSNKSVALTFDDGWKSDLEVGKLLSSFNMKATFYVISGTLTGSEWQKASYLSRDELKKLADIPGMEIGAHSHTHFNEWEKSLDKIDERIVYGEVIMSKLLIEDVIGKPVVSFSWPFGYSQPSVVKHLYQLGFTSAVDAMTNRPNIKGASPYSISRFNVDGACTANQIREMLEKRIHLPCK